MTYRDSIYRYLLGKPDGAWPASVRECAAVVGITVSTAQFHLNVLEREGLVERGPNRIGVRAVRKEVAA